MSLADDYVDSLQPWLTADLEDYLRAVGAMFEETELLSGGGEGFNLFDVDEAPTQTLPWLAQIVGERLTFGIADAAAREWIRDHPKQQRGTERAIFLSAQRTLTGTRLVTVRLRTRGDGTPDADYITVRTIKAQTPDPAAVYADLRKNMIPADIVLDYSTIVGQTWLDVKNTILTLHVQPDGLIRWNALGPNAGGFLPQANNAGFGPNPFGPEQIQAEVTTWQDIKDIYTTWDQVHTTLAGQSAFARPEV